MDDKDWPEGANWETFESECGHLQCTAGKRAGIRLYFLAMHDDGDTVLRDLLLKTAEAYGHPGELNGAFNTVLASIVDNHEEGIMEALGMQHAAVGLIGDADGIRDVMMEGAAIPPEVLKKLAQHLQSIAGVEEVLQGIEEGGTDKD